MQSNLNLKIKKFIKNLYFKDFCKKFYYIFLTSTLIFSIILVLKFIIFNTKTYYLKVLLIFITINLILITLLLIFSYLRKNKLKLKINDHFTLKDRLNSYLESLKNNDKQKTLFLEKQLILLFDQRRLTTFEKLKITKFDFMIYFFTLIFLLF